MDDDLQYYLLDKDGRLGADIHPSHVADIVRGNPDTQVLESKVPYNFEQMLLEYSWRQVLPIFYDGAE